jgi:hypothetical protein
VDEGKNEDEMTAIKLLKKTGQPIEIKVKVAAEKAPETKSQGPTMEWLTKNFAVVSAVVVRGAAALSLILLLSYLTVFDPKLIWLVEYSDLTKLFLLFGALFGGAGIAIIALWQGYSSTTIVSYKVALITMSMFTIIYQGIDLYDAFNSENGRILFHLEYAFCQLTVISLLIFTVVWYHDLINGDRFKRVSLIILTLAL